MDKLCIPDPTPADTRRDSFRSSGRPSTGPLPVRGGILIVDDEASVRLLLEVALRQQGFTVFKAADGQEALSLFRRHRGEIALVLLDIRMPVLDGPQTLAALRQVEPPVRCCFMTGQSGDYSHERLMELGAACVFEKPFRLAELLQVVDELVGSANPVRA